MGIETLNTAARAAGFAMAASEEVAQESKVPAGIATEAWPSEPGLPAPEHEAKVEATAGAGEWLKSIFGVFGRGAPA
jgi:hypothetical protein